MKKKYIFILVIAIAVAAGLLIYQNQKREKELIAHHNRQYNRMIDVAQKSPMAGLAHMGRALNNYKEKNGAYPARLSALHPEFIPVKAFIDDIQWHYKPSRNSFYLSKTTKGNGDKLLTASIGPDLMPQKESDIAVAAVETPKKIAAGTEIKPSKKLSKTDGLLASTEKSKTMIKTKTQKIPSTSLSDSRGKLNDFAKAANSTKRPLRETEKTVTRKLTEKEQFIHGIQSRQEVLVWKNHDGSLGFSNIQYPRSKELMVYDKGEWVQIRRRNSYARTRKDAR